MVFFVVAILVLALDRLTKWYISTHMEIGQSIPVIPHVFHITYIRNPGAAFGLWASQAGLFVIITVVVVVLIIVFARHVGPGQTLLRFALGLELGGALGNLYDRVLGGAVIDFLDFRVWPVFNLADTAIVTGGFLFILYLVLTWQQV